MPSRQEWASIFMNGSAHSCAAADSPYVFLVSDRLLPGDPLSAYGHFPRRGKQGPPGASAPTARTSSGASRHLPRVRGRLWAAGGGGPYGEDLIRRFAPPSPCAGKALGRRCRDPSSAKQSLERRALPARRDAPQDDSEGPSRNSERTPNSAIPKASSRPGAGKRLAWRGGICYHTGSTLTQEERSFEHS